MENLVAQQTIAKSQSNHNRPDLDANPDINHWSYRVPGLFVWALLIGFILLMVFIPKAALEVARIMGFYALFRISWIVIFYLLSLWRVKQTQDGLKTAPQPTKDIHHVIVLPSYKEPVEVLARTLDTLMVQENARECISVVLAMEAVDPQAGERAKELEERYRDRFARILISLHPQNLPGEAAGKAANQTYAMRQVRHELIDVLGLDINKITLTASDADSHFHPHYFAELARKFTSDPKPHNRIWQAPLVFDSNIWKVRTTIRLMTFFVNAIQLSELTNPVAFAMPISTYSMSFRLADEVGYWDKIILSDDFHMYLRCMFGLSGDLRMRPIFLPIHGEAVAGTTSFDAWKNYYTQQVRHAWGAQDISYILQKWNHKPITPAGEKLVRLGKMFFDHIFLSLIPIIIVLGSILAIYLKGEFPLTLAGNYAVPLVVILSNSLSLLGSAILWIVEHIRCRQTSPRNKALIISLFSELFTWCVMPVFALVLVGVPILHAQTKLMLASPLIFVRTPRESES